jgi:hypothetical protein
VGYGSSGPAQLALALVADALGDEKAARLHQAFKWKVVVRFPACGDWTLTWRCATSSAPSRQETKSE